jgi:hypothetical protein
MRLYKGLLRFTEQLVNLVRNAMVWWLKERRDLLQDAVCAK